MYLRLLLFFGVLLQTFNTFAQDPYYTQKFANTLFTQPALTGVQEQAAVGFQYRDQWDVYKTTSFFYSQQVNFLRGGIGVQVMNDKADLVTTQSILLSYAPAFKLNEKASFRAGIQASFGNRTTIVPATQLQDRYTRSDIYPDFNAGFALLLPKLFASGSIAHLTKPSTLKRRYSFLLGGFIPIEQDYRGSLFAPYLSYEDQGLNDMITGGLNFSKWIFTAGVSRRWTNAGANMNLFNFLLGVNVGRFKVAYSHDSDRFSAHGYNANEISVVIHLGQNNDPHTPHANYFRRMF